jgi:hypothetical protein
MNRDTGHKLGIRSVVVLSLAMCVLLAFCMPHRAESRDLLPPKEQKDTGFDETKGRSFDDQKRGVPQSIFISIQMARGYEVEWDSFGRQGWYTQDPRIKAIDPGTTVFTPTTPAIYVVFEVAPLEDPAQFGAQCFWRMSTARSSQTRQ